MAVRPIDANALQELCNRRIQDTWNSRTAPVSWAEAYSDFKNDIDPIPTLTPPNEAPPCYQPDGDGCAYQCYDGDDEPIEKCKECPLCYSDKQRHYTPPNEPLTIEQLRQMDGCPVYVVPKNELSELKGWCVVFVEDGEDDYSGAYPPGTDGWCWSLKSYADQWLAYAYPPAHIDREAWKPCLFCCVERKGRKTLTFDEAGDAVTIEIDGNAAAIESDSMGFIIKFCPECGRPLTDKAWDELEKRLRGVRE